MKSSQLILLAAFCGTNGVVRAFAFVPFSESGGRSDCIRFSKATESIPRKSIPTFVLRQRLSSSLSLSSLADEEDGDQNSDNETTAVAVTTTADSAAATTTDDTLGDKVSKLDVGQVLANLQSGGDLGTRGEVYVVGQFALIFCILVGGLPVVGDSLRAVVGPLVLVGGLVVIGLSLLDLGTDSLTPFLPPTESGSLKTTGVYKLCRHPLYAGLLAAMGGLSVWTNSSDRLLLTIALGVLLNTKADIEEGYLVSRFPDDYPKYQTSVPGKFLPPLGLLDGAKETNDD